MFLRQLRRRIPKADNSESVSQAQDSFGMFDEEESKPLEDDPIPTIQPVTSYGSSCSTDSSCATTSTLSSLRAEVSELVQMILSEEESMDLSNEYSYEEDSPASSVDTRYFSNDDLETLVAPEFLEELDELVEREEVQKREEKRLRKRLIQQELDSILEDTRKDLEIDGQDLEPEAIEALGIAANKVAYLRKRYHVPSCRYIYMPSVAETILNGSLLEEACMHYFGAKEEFLVAYAGSLGTTIIRKQMHVNVSNDHSATPMLSPVHNDVVKEASRVAFRGVSCNGATCKAASNSPSRVKAPVKESKDCRGIADFQNKIVWSVVIGIFLVSMISVPLSQKVWQPNVEETITKMIPNFFQELGVSSTSLLVDFPASEEAIGVQDETRIRIAKSNSPFVPNLLYY